MSAEETPDLERGRVMFEQSCDFMLGVANWDQLPDPDLPEIAFAGRSNVGKSSLLNALTNRKTLARTSNTPGRTRELNYFNLAGALYLVDLPGFGYARTSRDQVQKWTRLVNAYFRGRPSLRRVCLLIDSRHGIKPVDREVMGLLDEAAVPYQAVLTKTDKLKSGAAARIQELTLEELCRRPAAHPVVIPTSATKRTGIPELREELAALAPA